MTNPNTGWNQHRSQGVFFYGHFQAFSFSKNGSHDCGVLSAPDGYHTQQLKQRLGIEMIVV